MRCYSCRKYDDCERPWKCDGTMYDCTAYELEQTNEEWFVSLPTEEKAKFIFWQHFDVYGKTLYELMVNASNGVARDKQAEVMIGAVVEWLKQPHTKGVTDETKMETAYKETADR